LARIAQVKRTISLLVTLSLPLLDLWVEHLGLVVGRCLGQIFEDRTGVKQARVDALRGFEAAAHDEDFG
jgi:hypothetical protein